MAKKGWPIIKNLISESLWSISPVITPSLISTRCPVMENEYTISHELSTQNIILMIISIHFLFKPWLPSNKLGYLFQNNFESWKIGFISVFKIEATITNISLQGSTDYYVNITAGSFYDGNSNDYAGLADKITWNFKTE